MKIYTKTGDKGETSLFSGKRVSKAHKLIESFGALDELNTSVGGLISSLRTVEAVDYSKPLEFLENLQSQIFSVGSYLASECSDEKYIINVSSWVSSQEEYMDLLDKQLSPLKNFILPGGADSACRAHQCRVLARKAERLVVGIDLNLSIDPVVIYLNRLSDLFFVFSRWINQTQGIEEPIWKS
ncbi:MAG: cob(I)yrinic acid a,c-diamide adenosyltransferase [Bdellovibrionales bacterium]